MVLASSRFLLVLYRHNPLGPFSNKFFVEKVLNNNIQSPYDDYVLERLAIKGDEAACRHYRELFEWFIRNDPQLGVSDDTDEPKPRTTKRTAKATAPDTEPKLTKEEQAAARDAFKARLKEGRTMWARVNKIIDDAALDGIHSTSLSVFLRRWHMTNSCSAWLACASSKATDQIHKAGEFEVDFLVPAANLIFGKEAFREVGYVGKLKLHTYYESALRALHIRLWDEEMRKLKTQQAKLAELGEIVLSLEKGEPVSFGDE